MLMGVAHTTSQAALMVTGGECASLYRILHYTIQTILHHIYTTVYDIIYTLLYPILYTHNYIY